MLGSIVEFVPFFFFFLIYSFCLVGWLVLVLVGLPLVLWCP